MIRLITQSIIMYKTMAKLEEKDLFPWFNTPTVTISQFAQWYKDDYGYTDVIANIADFLTETSAISTDIDAFCTWFYQG